MPDKVVEFINASKTYSELQTGVNIVSNAANEQAVVKDLKIESGVSGPFTIKVGDAKIAETTGGLLSGAELVGESTIMKLFGPTMLLNRFLWYSSGVVPETVFDSFFEGAKPKTSSSTTGSNISGGALTVAPLFMCFAANGDFYYASTSGEIYRRAGSVTGEQTNQTMHYAGMCYDGARYIYSFADATTLKVLDTTTNTISTVTCGTVGALNAAETTACAMDGYVWVKNSGAGTGKLVNATTGATVAAGGLVGTAAKYNCAMGKDSFGNYVVVWGDDTAPFQGYTILGKDLANISPVNGVFLGVTITDVLSGTGVCMSRVTENNRYIISIIGTAAYIFDLDTKNIITITGLTNTAATGPKLLYPDAARAASALGNVQVRATGVKTTL